MNFIYKYFPFINKCKYEDLKIDDIGLYSISTPKNADIISRLIKKHINKENIIITDAMAGVGGNTLSFSSFFYYVISIELDKTRFNYLTSNINVYSKTNILCIQNDYLNIMNKLKQDVIFLDPPWGGRTYKEHETISLTINDIMLEDISEIIRLEKICSLLVLKLPLNYDTSNFSDGLKENMIIDRLPKMLIVLFKIN